MEFYFTLKKISKWGKTLLDSCDQNCVLITRFPILVTTPSLDFHSLSITVTIVTPRGHKIDTYWRLKYFPTLSFTFLTLVTPKGKKENAKDAIVSQYVIAGQSYFNTQQHLMMYNANKSFTYFRALYNMTRTDSMLWKGRWWGGGTWHNIEQPDIDPHLPIVLCVGIRSVEEV